MPTKKEPAKKIQTKETKEVSAVKAVKKPDRYVEGVGRRKTAIARVRVLGGHGKFLVNEEGYKNYFDLSRLHITGFRAAGENEAR